MSEIAGRCARDDVDRVETDDPLVGEEIGGYRVVAVIGEGGMGRVYRAVQPSIGAQVAIKVLSHRLAGVPELAERFVAEARTANLVRHDGLVNVIGAGVLPDRRPYQIMELLHGVPLLRVLLRGTPSLGAACNAIREALHAVAVLHGRGIVHRDLTPANLFVTTAGRIKVIDFGIAKVLAAPAMTLTGQAVGTPRYMAPEQAEGTAIDHRVDLYALGVVLAECVTGTRAVTAPTGNAMLDEVIATATQPDRDRRFATAMEMERALTAVIETLPEDAFAPLLPPSTGLPETIGKYEIQAVLGRGSGGVVMLARDPDLRRRVALKLLHAPLLDEAQAMARVAHPNVVAVYEVGVDRDRVFMVMEYVEGQDLARWLDEPRSWQDIVKVFLEAGRGMAAAHDAGITHRDFKPSNVVIGKDGRPRVGDFGLAHEHGEAGKGGTPAYMAPEQRAGERVDALSDQYAFCAALWEALHGSLPDRSMVTVRETAPIERAIPPKLDAIIHRGLGDRRARYASMRELLVALEAEIAPRASKTPWIAGGVLAVAGLGVLLATRSTPSPSVTPDAAPVSALADLATGSPSDILRAVDGNSSVEARTLAGDAAMRGPTRVLSHGSEVTAISLSDDGARLVVATADEVVVHHGSAARSLRSPGEVRQLAFAGNAVIALTSDGLVELGERSITERVRCPREGIPSRLVASERLRYIACPTVAGLRVIDRDAPSKIIELIGNPVLTFEPITGRMVASTSVQHVAYDLKTSRRIGRVQADSVHALLVGDDIALSSGTKVILANPVTQQQRTLDGDFAIRGLGATGGAHPYVLAWSSKDNKLMAWRASGKQAFQLEPGAVVGIAVARDRPARLVLQRQHEVVVRDLDSDRELALSIDARDVSLSADGSTIAISHGTQVTLWYPDLRPPSVTPIPLVMFDGVAMDGSRVAYCDGTSAVVDGVRVPLTAECKRVAFGDAGVVAVVDVTEAVWTRKPGGSFVSLGAVPVSSSALSVSDASHAAVLDAQMRVHWFADGVEHLPCGSAKASSWMRTRAIVTEDAATAVCDFATGARRPIEHAPDARWRWSGDASRVLRLAGERIAAFRADGTREPFAELDRIVEAVPDHRGQRVVANRREVGLVVLEGQRPAVILAASRNARAFDISPDGTRIAAWIDRQLRVWDVAHPDRPRDLALLATRSVFRFELTNDALFTVQVGLDPATPRDGFAIDRWPLQPPEAEEVAAWIRRVAPR